MSRPTSSSRLWLLHLCLCLCLCLCVCRGEDANRGRTEVLGSNSLLRHVVTHAPTIGEADISEAEKAVMRTAHSEEEEMATRVHFCIKDYSITCPEHWKQKEIRGEVMCVATGTYIGFCERVQKFGDMSIEEKIHFESSCSVQWGCKNALGSESASASMCPRGRDYYQACPNGFRETEGRNCVADVTTYDGMCNGEMVNFSHFTDEEKEQWGKACGTQWPCIEECEEGQQLSKCPTKWIVVNEFECEPTEEYTGVCKHKKSFKYFTIAMKKTFEMKCQTRFGCADSCTKNYKVACPVGWILKNKTCEAPEEFDLCPRKTFSVDAMSIEEKPQFERDCSVEWPCDPNWESDICEMDWSADCPHHWTGKTENKKWVCSPDSNWNHSPNCSVITFMENASEEVKREMASACDVPWPCVDQSLNLDLSKMDSTKSAKLMDNGPITHEGKIFRKGKYSIREETTSDQYDIMK